MPKRSCSNFGQLAGADQRFGVDDEGDVGFGVAVFAHVQVQHELDQGAVHDREVAGQDGVARPGQARGGAEVHLAQRFAEGHVVLHVVAGGTRLAPALQFAIGAFVFAVRDGFIEQVGQVQLDLAQAGLDGLELAAGVRQDRRWPFRPGA